MPRQSILGGAKPDTTGRCFLAPYDNYATNDLFRHLVFVFNDPSTGQAHGIYGKFDVPDNFGSAPVIIPIWTATAITGNCRWRFSYRAIGGDDLESLDQATFQEQVSVTDVAPGAAHRRLTPSMSLTAANLAAADTIEYLLERLDDGGLDTMAAVALLHDLIFSYTAA